MKNELNVSKLNPPAQKAKREELAKKLGVRILPLLLVISKSASEVEKDDVIEAFTNEIENVPDATLVFYAVDKEPYYHAYYGGSDNQMEALAFVKAWYCFKKP
jgi:hypothetical protein